jgi:hypothetical protein
VEPARQTALGLIAQPQPSEFDHRLAQEWIAGLRGALFTLLPKTGWVVGAAGAQYA